ncbi:DHHC palmitoyltransferase-domain-containing protein [Lipomyces arxii]|uniref:DHHC palmitoyltransferase-domain-containing protein n=1 Tax=Lipomyces arxii TaxID=56418 RepID=UPI0034CE06BF
MVHQLKWRFLGIAIPVTLIAGIGYGSDIFIFQQHLPHNLLIRHRVYVHLIWITYALAVFAPVGSPPRPFSPDPQLAKICTYCRKCQAIKPPRAHHCRVCNTCVLRMDHHCPWTNNCVGHRNLLHFVRFLFSVVVGTSSVLYHLCERIGALWKLRNQYISDDETNMSELVALVVLTPAALLVIFTVGLLFIRTVWNLAENVTLIETWERERVEGQIRRKRLPKVEFPYDLGSMFDNMFAALGPMWRWPLLWTEPPTDGMHFEMNEEGDSGTIWPPADPDEISPYLYNDRPLPPTNLNRSVRFPTPFLNERAPSLSNYEADTDSEPDEGQNEEEYWRRDKWQSWEGERLEDFGVDVEADAGVMNDDVQSQDGDDENMPLGVVKRKLVNRLNVSD